MDNSIHASEELGSLTLVLLRGRSALTLNDGGWLAVGFSYPWLG